jgi:DnaJ family protein A protein 5
MDSEDHFEHNIRVTTAGEIISMISKFNSSISFTDSPDGFYGILRSTFEKLGREEDAACSWEGLERIEYPDFGEAEDSYEDVVRPFYSVWIGFATRKTFSWKDTYNYAEAPDRRIRRLMEKENKRLREEAVREFNDAVRSLVSFVRKRDKRFIPNTQSEADRQKILRDAAAAQAARSRAANEAKLAAQVVPDWAKNKESTDEIEFSESEQSDEEHFECVICGKTFKSEKQYDSHEKSKKHIKAVQQLKWEMHKENRRLNLDSTTSSGVVTPGGDSQGSRSVEAVENSDDAQFERIPEVQYPAETANDDNFDAKSQEFRAPVVDVAQDNTSRDTDISDDENSDDEYASRAEVESRLFKFLKPGQPELSGDDGTKMNSTEGRLILSMASTAITSGDASDNEPQVKMGKAKAKRAKKAARQDAAMGQQDSTVKGLLILHIQDHY